MAHSDILFFLAPVSFDVCVSTTIEMTVSRNWLKRADAIILSPSFHASADKIWDCGNHCHDIVSEARAFPYGTPIPILFLGLRAFLQKTPLKGIPLTSCLAPSPRSYGPKKGLLWGLKNF
jgi:hypothetical protein